jgi:hypothetical protein
MIIYFEELKEFNKQRLQYVIVGGMAFNLLGGFRSTADLDILIEMTELNLSKLVKILFKHGYKLLQPIDPMDVLDKKKIKGLVRNKNMKTLSFLKDNSLHEVDVIIESPVNFTEAKKSVIPLKIDGLCLPVVGIDELIAMKKAAWRPIDKADIADLKVLKKVKANG